MLTDYNNLMYIEFVAYKKTSKVVWLKDYIYRLLLSNLFLDNLLYTIIVL